MHLKALNELAGRFFPVNGNLRQELVRPTAGLLLLRQESLSTFESMLYEPVLCLILQGGKEVAFGEQCLSFGPGECLLISHDLPVSSRITRVPYLALVFEVKISVIRKLHDQVGGAGLGNEKAQVAAVHGADAGLVDALSRYLALSEVPAEAKVLGPLISQEIHYRLLLAPFGGMLRNLISQDSNASAIARAIGQIRGDIRLPIAVPDLARQVGMSVSSFHKHFKTITSTTPLQYQKELRLLEARRLLQMGGSTVTTAAFDVGYESPSQFSREYARKFGNPPSRDAARMHG